jgi:hypothetical protein|nr:MAG: hypothetical protein DIU52_05900 [bacterium]
MTMMLLAAPGPAAAQLGAVEALLRNATDLSFYFNTGGFMPSSDALTTGDWGLAGFGVELLFEVGRVHARSASPTATVAAGDDARRWTEMRIVRKGEKVDTTYVYEDEVLWTFELGVGYGQVTGFRSRDAGLDLRGAVRDLPAVSLYANYEPLGAYAGLRSGFMRTQGLQVYADDGTPISGTAESFLAGMALGKSLHIGSMTLFLETAYWLRHFPSVQWSSDAPLPPGTPRALTLSGWSIGTGIQFGVGSR